MHLTIAILGKQLINIETNLLVTNVQQPRFRVARRA